MTINERIQALRKVLTDQNIKALIIPSSDPHQSEYIADHWKCREWISAFTGSAGTVIVTDTHAGLWTDSRYFIQAVDELAQSEFELHKVYNQFSPTHLQWLKENLNEGDIVGVDGLNISVTGFEKLSASLAEKGIKTVDTGDLFNAVWPDRPNLPDDLAFLHPEKYQGASLADRLETVRNSIPENHSLFISALDDIAWLLHLRGRDVECNPVAIAYVIMDRSATYLYIGPQKLDDSLRKYYIDHNVTIKEYASIKQDLQNLHPDRTLLIDPGIASYHFYNATSAKTKFEPSVIRKLKAIKNDHEVEHVRNCMIKDGVALTKAFVWLEDTLASRNVSEYEFAMKLAEFRSQEADYFGESFNAIVGYGSNGAVIHYRPMPETAKMIEAKGTLLCDSGGQYFDGTTDITRTIPLETSITEEFKTAYTCVLQGMIDLETAIYPKGTNGGQLDAFARKYLWAEGLNYFHGTGHGVGYFLNVHEPPQGFTAGASPRANTILEEGMITSNEPGYYKDGAFGIRIENLILTKKHSVDGFYCHESLTLFPIDTRAIIRPKLTSKQRNWLNNYHEKVYEKLGVHLDDKHKNWLKVRCQAI